MKGEAGASQEMLVHCVDLCITHGSEACEDSRRMHLAEVNLEPKMG